MADSPERLYLQTALEESFPGLTVYFRPSKNIILKKPCIVYTTLGYEPKYANNDQYAIGTRFQITFLSDLPGFSKEDLRSIFSIKNVSTASNSSYVQNDVAHDVFTVTINKI